MNVYDILGGVKKKNSAHGSGRLRGSSLPFVGL